MCVRVHGGNLSTPPANASTNPRIVDRILLLIPMSKSGRNPAAAAITHPATAPGDWQGFGQIRLRRPSCRASEWGPKTTSARKCLDPNGDPPRAGNEHDARPRPTVPGNDTGPNTPAPRREAQGPNSSK